MAKHKYIESEGKMWALFLAYRKSIKAANIKKMVFVGKDGTKDYEERERPLTMEGFENFCYEQNEINDLGDYFTNKDNRYSEYATICTRIKSMIRQDQIEGGMAGIYNPSITQRLNGLKEQTESNVNANVNILNIDPLAD
jgi:hypothetical protein